MNKIIKSILIVLSLICFLSLVSCGVSSQVKSVVERSKENATAETMSSTSSQSSEYPKHDTKSGVDDFAGVFKQEEIDSMNKLISDLEKKTTAELAVVTVKSLNGKTIEVYSNELFTEWGIGKPEKNNGVLLLISMGERQLRIEVGYGLENVINDVIASNIINEVVVPYFNEGKPGQGTYEGAKAIAEEIISSQ